MDRFKISADDWKVYRKQAQERRARSLEEKGTMVENFCLEHNLILTKLSDSQYKIERAGYPRVDIYPASSKVKIFRKGSKCEPMDLRKFLHTFYKNALIR